MKNDKFTYDELIKRVTELEKLAGKSKRLISKGSSSEHEDGYISYFNNSIIAVKLYDIDGYLIKVNQACLDLFGVTDINKIDGFKLFEDPNIGDDIKAKILNNEKVRFNYVFSFEKVKEQKLNYNTHTEKRNLDCLICPIINNNRKSGYIVQIQDISGHKRKEDALRESEDRFRITFQNTPLTAFQQDRNLRYTWIHNLKVDLKPEDIIGKKDEDFVAPDYAEQLRKIKNKVLKSGIGINQEVSIIVLGKKYTYNLNIEPIRDEYNIIIGITGITWDITDRKEVEDALRDSEEKFRLISQLLPIGIYLTNSEGACTYVNTRWCEMTGLTFDEALGDGWIKGIHSEDREILLENWNQMISSNGFWGKEYRFQNKSGKITWVYGLANPQIDVNGNITGYIGVNIDITERRNAEKALLESEARFRNLLNDVQAISVQGYGPDGTTQYWNKASERLYGYKAEEAIGKNLVELIIPPEMRVEVRKAIQQMAETGKPIPSSELSLMRKDGSRVTVFSSHTIIQVDGRPQELFCIDVDLTDLKLAEEALKKEQHLIHALMFHLPEAIYFKDNESRFIRISNAQAHSFGLQKPEEAVGKTDFDYFSYEHAKQAYDDEQEIIRTGQPIIKEEKETWNDKPDSWVSTAKLPFHDMDEKIIGTFGISVNITERKLAEKALVAAKEKAEESDRLKTAFLQNMSHEIRSPMNAIMGFSELLVRQFDNRAKLEEYSRIINQRCKDLLKIINDILDISKIESGQFPVNLEECNLNDLLAELKIFFSEMQLRLKKQHITLSLKALIKPSMIVIVTDKVKLKQIFINLISNAIKFTDEGRIDGGCKFDENNNLLFFVSDTGIGIPEDQQGIIFDRFTQLYQDPGRNIGGTGLGLSIVKGLVNILGGDIWIKSIPGKGSTFSFTINYKTAKITKPRMVSNEELENLYFNNKTILVVEDDQNNSRYLKEILCDSGMNILLTESGKEAVHISLTQPVDLVLMDIRLPDMDGYEATRQIKQFKPRMNIIAQTAYASNFERQKAMDAGCNDYISKPIEQNLLFAIISKHLSDTANS